ncbi:MAG: hypothetical protein Q8P84_06505, partial [Deltaproteobacteria bacterium]|nr:hypothetical protein [Deltaproteobacteria bacterium]
EHPGDEHAGKPAKKEHPGEEHAGSKAPDFNAVQIKGAMKAHIEKNTKKGVFAIQDPKTQENLKLKFVKIHDPVRKIEGKGYFACTDFEVIGEKGKLYDLDFWLNPKDGTLLVTETKIHKEPKKQGEGWVKVERYTFVNDKPVVIK